MKKKVVASRRKKRLFQMEALEARLCMAASLGWDGPGQGSASLSYYIGSSPASLSRPAVEAALETALKAWSNVADISFTRATTPGLRDSLDFTFTALDGAGRALAQAYFPDDVNPARIAGDIQFDSAESWEIGNGRGNAAFDLVQVAVHEIGHALGLNHARSLSSIMYGSVAPSQSYSRLPTVDVQSILSLYAAQDGVTNADPTATPTETTRTRERFNWRGRRGSFNETPAGGERVFAAASRFQNGVNRFDVNGDRHVTPADALRVINQLNSRGSRSLESETEEETGFVDCNGDDQLTPMDALSVINRLNSGASAEEGSTEVPLTEAQLELETLDDQPTDTSTDPLPDPDSTPIDESSELPESPTDLPDESASNDDPGSMEVPTGSSDDPLPDESGSDDGGSNSGDDDTDDQEDSGTDDGSETGNNGEDEEDSECDDGERHGSGDDHDHPRVRFLELDANSDGSLTSDEVPENLWTRLVAADANNDGALSLEELAAILPGRFLERIDLFGRFDADDDGELESDEVPAGLWERLLRADTDESGSISREELAAFKPVQIPGRFDLFGELDGNDDGVLTEDELPAVWWTVVQAADANDDGQVSKEELASFRPRQLLERIELFGRLDGNDDGILTEEEIPGGLWRLLQGADTNADGEISPEEFESFRPTRPERPFKIAFDVLDDNGDGLITETEVPPVLWGRLQDADTDGDGGISPDELAAFRPTRPEHPFQVAFDVLDDNGDGLLSQDELPEAMWTRLQSADTNHDGGISPDELREILPNRPIGQLDRFARLDENGDGSVTAEEVRDRLWERLSAADTNGDGAISAEEWAAFHSQSTDDQTPDEEPEDRPARREEGRGLRGRFGRR